ncbi:hypothetical protein M408DRAFT_225919 [Serendipita vermifera MAFF 305830]|uniref:BAG domain-containing protein n=1 Tax=Serendipita vermifera MAFF 305830 TaxID=933852 RepID=A0A0C3AYB9_SERVB|nr:hypothetical protein M408DRAFT_225919 [Serendipita vermifera MAFF 305830]
MFFVYNPQEPSPVYFNPEDAYAAYRRREYIAALEEEQRRIQFERELSTAQQPPIAPMSSILAQGKEQPKQEPKGTTPATKQSAAEAPTAQYSPDEEPEPHWSAVPERGRTLAEVTSISRAFESLKNTFVFPSGPLEAVSGSNPPRLSYNKINAPIHAYQHALSELVTKLDGIESYGFKGLREARKQLVVKIDEEMEQLDKKIMATLTSSSEQKQPTDTEPTEKPTSEQRIISTNGR